MTRKSRQIENPNSSWYLRLNKNQIGANERGYKWEQNKGTGNIIRNSVLLSSKITMTISTISTILYNSYWRMMGFPTLSTLVPRIKVAGLWSKFQFISSREQKKPRSVKINYFMAREFMTEIVSCFPAVWAS